MKKKIKKVPILLYHEITTDPNKERYTIDKKTFEEHIKYLYENNFMSYHIKDLYNLSSINNDKSPVIITFDDGKYSDYSIALPILKKYGFVATFFITANWIGTTGYLDWKDIKVMLNNGMSIQSHGLTHTFLTTLSQKELNKELIESKEILEKNTKETIDYISIPGGFYNKNVIRSVKNSGYKGVFTSDPGFNTISNHVREFQVFNRFVITRATSFESFKSIVSNDFYYVTLMRFEFLIKKLIKKSIGADNYYKLWKRFFKEV